VNDFRGHHGDSAPPQKLQELAMPGLTAAAGVWSSAERAAAGSFHGVVKKLASSHILSRTY
jgi:hypothetical protein